MIERNVMRRTMLLILGACFSLTNAHAFEVTTHGAITREAWSRFLGDNPGVLDRLGIRDIDDAFGTFYHQPAPNRAPAVVRWGAKLT